MRFPAAAQGKTPTVRLLWALLCLLPVAGVFWFSIKYRFKSPYWDEWELLKYFQRFHDGTLHLLDLMDQHNEHRMFFPKLFFVASAALTKWNMLAENLVTDAMLALSLAVVYRRASRQFGFAAAAPPPWFVPAAFVMLSWRQWEIMLIGILLAFVMAATFSLLSFYSLEKSMEALAANSGTGNRKTYKAFAAALACATVATFSSAHGLMAWPCALVIFALSAPRVGVVKTIWPYVLVWFLAAAIEGWFYSIGFSRPHASTDVFMVLKHPESFIRYFLCISGSLMPGIGNASAYAYGALLIASAILISCLAAKLGALRRNAFWLAVMSYALAALAAVSAGRFGLGMEQALSPRYALFSVLLVVPLFMLSVDVVKAVKPGAARILPGILPAFIILAPIWPSYINGYVTATHNVRDINKSSVDVLLRYRCVSDEKLDALKIHVDGKTVRARAAVLERLGYGIFRPKILYAKYPEYPRCD